MALSESLGSSHRKAADRDELASLAEARIALEQILSLPRKTAGLRAIAIAAPVAPVDALFAANAHSPAVLWDPASGISLSGIGVAQEIVCELSMDTKAQAIEFFDRLQWIGSDEISPPRLIGGFAFTKGSASDAQWARFGDGLFILPRWTYLRNQHRAWLSLCISDAESLDVATTLAQLNRELEAIWAALLWYKPSSIEAQSLEKITHTPEAAWRRQVQDIRQRIAQGSLEKVVAARRSEIKVRNDVHVMALLTNLGQRYPGCTRFALWRGDSVFLGASPEKLISRFDREVTSEALAGSLPPGKEVELLASDKERLEHQLVVDALRSALEECCDELRVAESPCVAELPNLLHMQTPIEGHLARDVHVLDLVATLHPTPAVCGVPRENALQWISQHEECARGWYSAPFGWIDADGDGEFLVALRSGLVRQDQVWVYAGAGIMRGSEPDAEYDETALKMQALLGAFDDHR